MSLSRSSRLLPWLVAATATATVLVPASTAAATWHTASRTFIEYRDVCRDGIRFGAAVREGSGPEQGPFKNRAIVVQPAPVSWAAWDQTGKMMDVPISIPEKEGTIDVAEEGYVTVTHEGSFTMRYHTAPLELAPVALSVVEGFPESSMITEVVTNCFLFAPIDVQPGSSSNKVPIGHGQVSVAVLGTKTMKAGDLAASSFRFGPKKAKPNAGALRDVNGDKRADLVLRFSSKKAGLKCSTRTVALAGTTTAGGVYEGSGKVKPTGC